MVPLFDFLRKKGKVKIDIPTSSTEVNGNKLKNADAMNVTGDAGSSESSLTAQANINENSREITIPDAVALLRSQGEIKVKDLVEGLMPIKLSVEKLLKNTEKIADDLEKENIKMDKELNKKNKLLCVVRPLQPCCTPRETATK